MLGRIKIKGLSLDVSAVIFIALLFGHFGVIIPKELGNFGLVLFLSLIHIFTSPSTMPGYKEVAPDQVPANTIQMGAGRLVIAIGSDPFNMTMMTYQRYLA